MIYMKKRNLLAVELKNSCFYYLLLLVPVIIVLIFRYYPMGALIIAFKRYDFSAGIWGSDWVGLKWFQSFLASSEFWRVLKNTILLSFLTLLWGFPAPIIFALSLNEVRNEHFKKITQTISYLPHFISTVVVVGMIMQILSPSTGIVNTIIKGIGFEPIFFMGDPKWFRTVYVASGIWQDIGWSSIIYIAALTSIDQEYYEAALIDGAGRFAKMIYITLPCILPTIMVVLLLRLGNVLDVGFEKVFLMYSPAVYDAADVIETFVYRRGLRNLDLSYASAVGLFKSAVGLFLVTTSNYISKKYTEVTLW